MQIHIFLNLKKQIIHFFKLFSFNTPATLAGFLLICPHEKENIAADRFVTDGFLCYFYDGKQQNKCAR